MAKKGRPGITYDRFVEVWERLREEGREGNNAVHDILGGSKSTIGGYREKYEREQKSRELSLLKTIKLTDAVHQAIANVKLEEVQLLEKVKRELESRIDTYIKQAKEAEDKLSSALVDMDDLKVQFDVEKLKLERKAAAATAKAEELEKREKKLIEKLEKVSQDYSEAKQQAAVAKKEVELLREQAKKSKK